jgi:hypothetical protein
VIPQEPDSLYFEREPHPLPKTREWVADYKRWVAEGCPSPEEEAARRAVRNPVPDLQKLIEHQGGYPHITAEDWAEFDRVTAEWRVRVRAQAT